MSLFLPDAPYVRAMLSNVLGCNVPSDAVDSFNTKSFDERLEAVATELEAMTPDARKKFSTILRPYVRRAVEQAGKGEGE